jgi:2'-hydroxyisoflavone reductase
VRVAKGGEVLAPGEGSDPVQFIDVRDLAAFIVLGVERDLTGTYNATGPPRGSP